MRFCKLHGAGNDFIIHLGAPGILHADWSDVASRLCARRTGIGGDGLVMAAPISSEPPVVGVLCVNADGSTATMCGNALRCVAWHAARELSLKEMTLLMAGVRHEAEVRDDEVWVTAEVGTVEMRRLNAVWKGRPMWFDAAHTGTEHVVAVVPDVDAIDAVACGRLIRHHTALAPLGTNVNFIQRVSDQQLRIRTYERGVEDETLSCGSGAVAAVVIAQRRGLVGTDREVTVHNRNGTPLSVRPHPQRHGRTYWLTGPVTCVFEGELTA